MMSRMSVLAVLLVTAYSAVSVVTYEGKTSRANVYSDGVRKKSVGADGGGTYSDESLQMTWMFGPGKCFHFAKPNNTRREEVIGKEVVDGHPTQVVKVTETWTDSTGAKRTEVSTQWRATDLGDLAIRVRGGDGKYETHLEHIVIGAPDPKLLAFPAPPCDAGELVAASTITPQVAGGTRTIRFDQGACELLVPLPIAMAIPSDYAVRSLRPLGCFWGAKDDLDRLLASGKEADFESIRRGVFWVRPSTSTEYDPVHRRFVAEDLGAQDEWGRAYRAMGAKNVAITSNPVGVFPSARVSMTVNGQRVYMLYLAVPNTDSPAILINYRPAGAGSAADDAVWKAFADSVQPVKK
jgi:hypothetical protein